MAEHNLKIKIIPYAKLLAIQFSLIGALAGLIYAGGGLIHDLITTGTLNWGTALAFLALIGMPLIFALTGLITGLVGGWLFNRYGRCLEKLELDLDFLDHRSE